MVSVHRSSKFNDRSPAIALEPKRAHRDNNDNASGRNTHLQNSLSFTQIHSTKSTKYVAVQLTNGINDFPHHHTITPQTKVL